FSTIVASATLLASASAANISTYISDGTTFYFSVDTPKPCYYTATASSSSEYIATTMITKTLSTATGSLY
ncbi:uncharacterized protein KQ657_003550, partial [Scheffersomyces spartinae]